MFATYAADLLSSQLSAMLMSHVNNNASQGVVTELDVVLCSKVTDVSNGDDKSRPISSG